MTDGRLDRTRSVAPPRLAAWLAGLRMSARDREFQLGDLAEEFQTVVVPDFGERAGRRWYWRQALRCLFMSHTDPHPAPTITAASGSSWFHDPLRDVRHAVRVMRQSPLSTFAAVLTLALGIGANAAIVSVAKPVLFDPLPVADEDKLTVIWLTYLTGSGGTARNPVAPGDYDAMRSAPAFERVEAFGRFAAIANLVSEGEPRLVTVGRVTPGFFAAVGVQPVLGRTLQPADAGTGGSPVVISESLWRSAFAGALSVPGRTMQLDGVPYTIVGVVPDWSGLGTRPADAWMVMDLEAHIRQRMRAYYLGVVGRLRSDATMELANRQLATIMNRRADEFPDTNGTPRLGAMAVPFREELTGPVRATFLILVGGAVMVLAIAAINIASLHLVRQAARRRELAIRHAVGASSGRLGRLVIIDSIVQAVAGGLAGLFAATITLSVLRSLAPPGTWYDIPARVPAGVAVLMLVASGAVGVLVGVVPAIRASHVSGLAAVRARPGFGDRSGGRGRATLVSAQIAFTLMLLIMATLVGTSHVRVLGIDPGFRTEGMLAADFALPSDRYPEAVDRTRFYDELIARVSAVPGVGAMCVASDVPLADEVGSMTWVVEADPKGRMVSAIPKVVDTGCFDVLGVGVLSGRLFGPRESDRELVVSQSMARALWPDEPDGFSPVGRRLRMGTPDGWQWTIVGMVADIRNSSLESNYTRQVWVPHWSGLWPPDRLIVRIADTDGRAGEVAALTPAIRIAVRDVAPTVALDNVRTMDRVVADATAARRFVLVLLAGFGVVALLLSAVGIYGVLAEGVAQRTPEIGLRMALGARAGDVARLVTTRMALAVTGGAVFGVTGAWLASAYVASLLFATSATDARVYATAGTFVVIVAGLAAWIPTRRAVRIDPLGALRQE